MLAMHFIDKKSQNDIDPPMALSQDMIPPSMRVGSSTNSVTIIFKSQSKSKNLILKYFS